jgi:hypothetical protein
MVFSQCTVNDITEDLNGLRQMDHFADCFTEHITGSVNDVA